MKGGAFINNKLLNDKAYLFQKLIKEDLSYNKVGELLGCSYMTVRMYAIKLGVPRVNGRKSKRQTKRLNQYDKEIVNLYIDQDISLSKIAKMYHTRQKNIKEVLISNGVKIKDKKEYAIRYNRKKTKRKYAVNEEYFKTWSPNMAYILGFTTADGNIIGTRFRIALKRDDVEILERIKSELSYEGEVNLSTASYQYGVSDIAALQIDSYKIVDSLKSLGLTENKSMTVEFPNGIPENMIIHFIRGYFDGDGTVGSQKPTNKTGLRTNTTQIRTRFCSGSEKMMIQIRDWLHENIGVRNVSVLKAKNKQLFEIAYSTLDSLKLYEAFYDDDSLFLKRKKDRFDEVVSQRKEDLSMSV